MPDRPTGTVTFLFTDIEGSTGLWEHHHDLMQEAFRRQEGILRGVIAAHGGCAYKMIGDAFQAAFQTALAALAASVDAQRALARENWGPVGPIRMRMALHTGTVEERGDDYVGPLLNRVARLLSTGYGGQILLTATTRELVRDSLPSDVSLRDLGEHRLKDLIRPEHVFQVVASGLQEDFPPLKSLDRQPTNLPLQLTPFIGRDREVAAVRERLLQPEVRLLTLTGPGGTGKTRLALQVAADLLDAFRDGVWFVNLAPISDPALVTPTIASTLDVTEVAGQVLLETLKAFLRNKQLLLVLDNFEQVLPAAPVVTDLVVTAPGLTVLVTSRTLLGLYGEHNVAVPPLKVPDRTHLPPLERLGQYEAVRLFTERAQAAKAGFTITNENAPAVAEICMRLDGLPLAIELAAARIRLLSPQALLQRLSNRLKLLTGGGRDLPVRQQTLRGAIEWSYSLLDTAEQTLFARLAVFVGGSTLEAVEAVCNAEDDLGVDVLDAIASLVDKSLLQQAEGSGGEPRFVMLETIREYAWERLEMSGEADAIGRCHAEYFLTVAERAAPELSGPPQAVWLQQLEVEHANLRAALVWTLSPAGKVDVALRLGGALGQFWIKRSYLSEGRRWLEAVHARSSLAEAEAATSAPVPRVGGGVSDPSLRARVLLWAGMLASHQGDYVAARSRLDASVALWRGVEDRQATAQALNALGNTVSSQGDHPVARRHYQESLELWRELRDRRGIATVLTNQGMESLDQGDYATARALAEESLLLWREVGDRWAIALVLNNLGHVALEEGDYAAARVHLGTQEQLLVPASDGI